MWRLWAAKKKIKRKHFIFKRDDDDDVKMLQTENEIIND